MKRTQPRSCLAECRGSPHQELGAPLSVGIHLSVQLRQHLVDVVQLRLQTFVLLMILVKFLFVVQTLFLVQDGRKRPAGDERSTFELDSRPRSVFVFSHSRAEVLVLQIVSRLHPRLVVLHPGLHGCHRTANIRVSAKTIISVLT